jgi:N utilization substance protein A
MNAMAPAEVVSIIVDEDAHSMDVAVREDQLSQAIGRNGQNVRLASQLTGWTLNVMTESQAVEKNETEAMTILELFMSTLEVDEDIATVLIQEGFSSLEEIAYIPINEMLQIEEFNEELVKELRNRAKEALTAHDTIPTIDQEPNSKGDAQPTSDLMTIAGMNEQWAQTLTHRGIITSNDLAEQSIDELMTLEGMDETQAAKLIMTARAPWFTNEQP